MSESTERIVPATTLHRFPCLPKEIRLQIWKFALPGPRIVYIQRRLKSDSSSSSSFYLGTPSSPGECYPPLPITYFTTSSPSNTTLTSLACTCQEASSIVRARFALITPHTPTWFSYDSDFLYLDFGRRYTLIYHPLDFGSSPSRDAFGRDYQPGELSPGFAQRVKNLAIYNNGTRRYMGRDLEQNVLKTFTGVEVLVVADQLHDMYEYNEELVWLRGEIGRELEDHYQQEQKEARYWLFLRNLLLWRDRPVYGLSMSWDLDKYKKQIIKNAGKKGYAQPKILSKSITTATVKRKLLEICGNEDSVLRLQGLDWDFVMGESMYTGDLDLSQQIEYLKLALGKLSTKLVNDDQGCELEGGYAHNVWDFFAKIEELTIEQGMLDLVISEAEETI